ncbi:MAG: glycosyltransferase [Oscillospiraceae bacterium]|nr:glycosyltransferase [Oscillospiraceae bacterium]
MSENLNICLINDSFPPEIDGVANAITNYADIITRAHGRATVVTPDNPEANDGVFAFPVLRYPSVDLTKLVGYYAGFPFSPDVQKSLVAEKFDLIHSHCPITSTMLARSLRDRIKVPVVMTYHTKFDIDIANAVSSKLLQEEAKKILVENISACDEIWTVSRGAGENLCSLGYEGDYIVMPNGVDFPRGRVDESLIEEVTAGFDLPEGVPVFLFVGRMMWYKGIRIILDALKALRESGQAFRMVFVGGGGDKNEIVAYSEKLGLSDVVFFAEPIHDRNHIRAWYCRADLFLFPSTFDTNGLVVREAAACALASVLIAGSCAAEDVEDGVSGFLIEENAESMAAKLLELCQKPEAVKAVGEGALRELYISWEEAVANACRRYEIVIDNYRAGKYPKHTGLTDDLIHTIAQSMDSYNRSRDFQKARMRELTDSYRKLRDDLLAEGQRQLENLQDGQNRLNAEIEAKQQLLRGKLDELTRYLDRFM